MYRAGRAISLQDLPVSRIVPAGGKSLPYQLCFEQWPRAANMLAQNV